MKNINSEVFYYIFGVQDKGPERQRIKMYYQLLYAEDGNSVYKALKNHWFRLSIGAPNFKNKPLVLSAYEFELFKQSLPDAYPNQAAYNEGIIQLCDKLYALRKKPDHERLVG